MNDTREPVAWQGPHLFESGLDPAEIDFERAEGFWGEVSRFTAAAAVDELVDRGLASSGSPRVWALLDEPGRTDTRSALALALARSLSLRGRKVLVLDVDDQRPDLTSWAGRSGQPGWVDFLRYGVSLSNCGVPLPWEGEVARLVGVGSFCPVWATVEEAGALISRLGHQADDLILAVATSGEARIWQGAANLGVVCWDRASSPASAAAALAEESAAVGWPVLGVVGLGRKEPEFGQALTRLDPVPEIAGGPGEEPEPTAEDEPEAWVGPKMGEPSGSDTEPVVSGREGSQTAGQDAGVISGPEETAEPEPATIISLGAGPEKAAPAGSAPSAPAVADFPELRFGVGPPAAKPSRWRWVVILAGIVVVLGVGGWWLRTGLSGREKPADLASAPSPADISPARSQATGGESTLLGPETDGEIGDLAGGQIAADLTEPARPAPPDREDLAAQPPAQGRESAAPDRGLSPAFHEPVGRAGWALWVFSVADSAGAVQQTQQLKDLGLEAVWRRTEVPDMGVWFRVYTGSFPNWKTANGAIDELLEFIGAKWAQPVRF